MMYSEKIMFEFYGYGFVAKIEEELLDYGKLRGQILVIERNDDSGIIWRLPLNPRSVKDKKFWDSLDHAVIDLVMHNSKLPMFDNNRIAQDDFLTDLAIYLSGDPAANHVDLRDAVKKAIVVEGVLSDLP